MNSRFKDLLKVTMFASLLSGGHALAHGIPAAKQGGQVVVNNEVSYELTRTESKTIIFIEDHGKAVETGKYSGKLILLRGSDKKESVLKPMSVNGLMADINVQAGDKLIARLNSPSGKMLSVRFEVR